MDCIQSENKAPDLFGADRHGFQAGNPAAGTLATYMTPAWCNGVQEEILNVIRWIGLVPSGADLSQMITAINAIITFRTGGAGEVKAFARTTAPAGWLKANGTTIGSAASGATQRANADTLALFSVLWDNVGNAELPIQDSTGAPSARGASAAADFAANKRMPLPDLRGEFVRGWDDAKGTDAGRSLVSGQGDSNKQHGHGVNDPNHAHGVNDPNHAHGVNDPNHAHGVNDPEHSHDFPSGPPVGGNLVNHDSTAGDVTISTSTSSTGITIQAGATGVTVQGNATGITIQDSGGPEARPRNVALLYCISY